MISLSAQLEGILFYLTKPIAISELARLTQSDPETITAAIEELRERLDGRGIILVEHNQEVSLGTHPDVSPILDTYTAAEQDAPLSRAALETFAIILYQGPVTKPAIDYIRGVNSQFMLRALLLRGLIEKVPNPDDSRSSCYQVTQDSLQFMGMTKVTEAPEYEQLRATLYQRLDAETASS